MKDRTWIYIIFFVLAVIGTCGFIPTPITLKMSIWALGWVCLGFILAWSQYMDVKNKLEELDERYKELEKRYYGRV